LLRGEEDVAKPAARERSTALIAVDPVGCVERIYALDDFRVFARTDKG
jgi:hypothetical protein